MLKKLVERFERSKKVSFTFLLIILGIITYFSSIPGSTISFGSIWPSIIYHSGIFAGFAFFLLAIFVKKKIEVKDIILTILISLVIAILDEIHQSFVPLRSSGLEDITIDLIGVILSVSLYYLIKKLD
ncbi:MAG: VanZ family protein [Nanoarchaeota archaeon]